MILLLLAKTANISVSLMLLCFKQSNVYYRQQFWCNNTVVFNIPSADAGMSLVQTCTENTLSVGISEMTVNDITPSDSIALLESFRN